MYIVKIHYENNPGKYEPFPFIIYQDIKKKQMTSVFCNLTRGCESSI